MNKTSKLKIGNKISEINRINIHIAQLNKEWKIPPKTVFDITLTLEEIVSNIIKYGTIAKDHLIILTFLKHNDVMVILIRDDGLPYNPLEIPEDAAEGSGDASIPDNVGINLAKALTESINYRRVNKINETLIQKKIKSY